MHIPPVPRPGSTAAGAAPPPLVHVLDDDASVRQALVRLFTAHGGYEVRPHESAGAFLASIDRAQHGCLVLDVSLPGLDGIGLQRVLANEADPVPIVFLIGHGSVPTCARAMRGGAVDFLTKPAEDTELLAAVDRALALDASRRAQQAHRAEVRARIVSLTLREREVIAHVMAGRLNKQIAGDIGTAEKTVKVHRARAMEKLRVRSVAELVRLIERADLSDVQAWPAHARSAAAQLALLQGEDGARSMSPA